MMRNAGRGDDGLAKAISTNNSGNIRTSKIKETKRLRFVDDLQPSETVTLLDTDKEVIIHSLVCHYTNDSLGQETFSMWFGSGTLAQTSYSVLRPEIDEDYSNFITPSYCVYDQLLETLVNEPGTRIVRLRNELHVKRLRIDLTNRGLNPNKIKFSAIYSEVE